jgi:hypothetical protein
LRLVGSKSFGRIRLLKRSSDITIKEVWKEFISAYRKVDKEKLQNEAVSSFRHPTPGSAIWRMVEVLKEELEKDTDKHIFDDRFADGLGNLLKESNNTADRHIFIVCASGAILLAVLAGYTLPISFPYVGDLQNDPLPSGILEIALVTFLFATSRFLLFSRRSTLYNRLLRAYIDSRYGENVRDLCLLRWGVDILTFYLEGDEYHGYIKSSPDNRFFRWLGRIHVLNKYITLPLSVATLIFISALYIILHPLFGWFSIIVVAVAVIHFLLSCSRFIASVLPHKYRKALDTTTNPEALD